MVIERLSKKHKTDKEEEQIGLYNVLKIFLAFSVKQKLAHKLTCYENCERFLPVFLILSCLDIGKLF